MINQSTFASLRILLLNLCKLRLIVIFIKIMFITMHIMCGLYIYIKKILYESVICYFQVSDITENKVSNKCALLINV